MNKRFYICEDNIEGIFTGVYDAYSAVCKHEICHEDVEIIPGDIENYQLFSEYIYVKTDPDKARKVTKSICEKMGYPAYEGIFFASTCDVSGKGTDIYMTIVEGYRLKNSFKILDLWTNDHVARVLELHRKANNELCRWKEFLQFREIQGGILYSSIGPVCNILPLLSSHFENRFPNENFIIHDENRDIYLIHEKQHRCVVVSGDSLSADKSVFKNYSANDQLICDLFKEFTKTIAIKERKNLKLQQQLMPLRIQNYKVEF